MAKQNRSAIVRYSPIIAAVICFIAFVLGFVKRGFEPSYYLKDKVEILNITEIEEITAKKDSIANDKFLLLNDIFIEDPSFRFGTGDNPFVGEFDGNGHTVYLNFAGDRRDDYSLFGVIGEGGVVKNTYFSFGKVTAASEVYAGIANVNEGTVQDCKINFPQLKASGNDGVFSPCIAVNYGTVSNVVAFCEFDCDLIDEVENAIVFGSICAYNYGILQNCIAVPTFDGLACVDEEQLLLYDKALASNIAAVCAVTAATAQTVNSAALLTHGVYTCDKNDNGIKIFSSSEGLFSNTVIFSDLGFDNHLWDLVGGVLNLRNKG